MGKEKTLIDFLNETANNIKDKRITILLQKEQKLKEIEGFVESDLAYCMQGWQIIKEIKKILEGKNDRK